MAELKNYVDGQPIEPIKHRVYSTIEEQAELKAYREFGDLSQLRALCNNYHELIDELRNNRATEAEIRAKAIDEFAEKLKREFDENIFSDEEKFKYDRRTQEAICAQNATWKVAIQYVEKLAEQSKEE